MSSSVRCPYPGLRSFLREEADLFFGREAYIDQMVDKLAETRFLAVLGSSGSGKSSLVRTGLLEALDLGLLARAGAYWSVAVMRPGDRPIRSLSRSLLELAAPSASPSGLDIDMLASFLARGPRSVVEWCHDGYLPAGHNLLLLVDQFEELFRYGDYGGRESAEAFVALLLESSKATDASIYVVLTMRSEFLGACALFPDLAERINEGLYLTPRMTRQEMREAIEGPAAICDFSIEPALINVMLNDLASFAPWEDDHGGDQSVMLSRRADQLPLMQHVLNRMWMQSAAAANGSPVRITLKEYEELGGLGGALNAHAKEVLDGLPAEYRAAVGRIFRALTNGSQVGSATRRPCRFGELVAIVDGQRDAALQVVNAFRARECNFLTPPDGVPLEDGTIVDISHESLIRQWSALREWLREESQSAETYRHIEQSSELWSARKSGLLTMPYLAVALAWRRRENPSAAWAVRYGGDFPLAMRFLEASARSRARIRYAAAALIGLFIVGSGTFGAVQFVAARTSESKLMTVQGNLRQLNGDLDQAKRQLKQINFANEMTDFKVSPKPTLEPHYNTNTPTTIPGGTVIFTKDLEAVLNSSPPPIMIDTLGGDHSVTIPGALRIPFAGTAGTFDDDSQHRLEVRLDNLTDGDHTRTLIFFCAGSSCWESYNASLRAIHAGYSKVFWYRGGLMSWEEGLVDVGFHVQTSLQEARALADKLTLTDTMPPKLRWAFAISLSASAGSLSDSEMLAYRELKALTQTLPGNTDLWSDYVAAGAQLWQHLQAAKKTDDAKAVYNEIKLVLPLVARAEVGSLVERRVLAAAIEDAGSTFDKGNDTAAALEWYRAARQAWATLNGKSSDAQSAQQHVASIDREIGWIQDGQKAQQDALTTFQAAEKIDRLLLIDAPADEDDKADLWTDLYDVGIVLQELKQYDAALDRLKEADKLVADSRKAKPNDVPLALWTIYIDYQIAATFRSLGKLPDAFSYLDANVKLGTAIARLSPDNAEKAWAQARDAADALGNLAYRLVLAGDFAKALEAADVALAVMPEQTWMQTNRAHALLFLGDADDAREIYLRFRGQQDANGRLWDDDLRSDFADLRKHGFTSPVMDQVEPQLKAAK